MLAQPYITLILLWIIFAIIHSGLASAFAMEKIGAWLGKYYRPVYSLLVLIVLFILIHYHYAAINTIMWRPHWIEKLLAGILLITGFAAVAISLWNNLLILSGIAGLMNTPAPQTFESGFLHRYVRHPLYTGVLFLLWGIFLGYPYMNNLISAVFYTLYMFIAIYFLERKLVAQYGSSYQTYRATVPMVLPLKRPA